MNVVDRKLEERGRLVFEYPIRPNGATAKFELPFWENPEIRESNQSRLVEYPIINRNGPLYSHTGSKARKITVDFQLSLPHIYQAHNSTLRFIEMLRKQSESVTGEAKKAFTPPTYTDGSPGLPHITARSEGDESLSVYERAQAAFPDRDLTDATRFNVPPHIQARIQRAYARGAVLKGLARGGGPGITGQPQPNPAVEENEALITAQQVEQATGGARPGSKWSKTIDSIVYMLDIIRSSVNTNATFTALGPPRVRLQFGPAYSNIPCICKAYRFEGVEDAGYDLPTLMPMRFKCMLELVEIRTGNFSKFALGTKVQRDNLPGWGSVLEGIGYDPGYAKK